MSNHPPPPPPAGPPPSYPPPSYPPGGGTAPRRTPWGLIVGAAVLAAVLVAGVAIVAVLATRDDDESPTGRATTADPLPSTSTPPITELSSATVPTDVATSAPQATPRDAVLGTWTGIYVCAQGDTKLRLTFDRGPGPADLTAVFAFGPTESNPDVPRGSYRMEGTISEGLLNLHATTWIKKPRGYITVDIMAPVAGAEPPHLTGDIIGAPQCSTFAVARRA